MIRRSGQSGTVVKKGRMWHLRYYSDVPGQTKRKRMSEAVGPIDSMNKSEAKRKGRSLLEQMGINSESYLERATQPLQPLRTFVQEAEWWKQNRLSLKKPSTQEVMASHVDKYLLPRFGAIASDAVDERQAQEFIAELSRTEYESPSRNGETKKLSPKSVRNIIGVLKLILGPRKVRDWSLSLQEDPPKEQRYFTPDEMQRIVSAAQGQWRPLFALLASSGLRIGEASGLHVDDLDLTTGKLYVRRSVWNGQEVSVKTKRGFRVVNVDPALVEMLRKHLRDCRKIKFTILTPCDILRA